MVIGSYGDNFYPLRHIIHCQKDVKIAIRKRKRADEVNSPKVKYLNNKNTWEKASYFVGIHLLTIGISHIYYRTRMSP